MAQLVRIRVMVEQRWSLKKNSQDSNKESGEDDRENEEGSKEEPGESQKKIKEETLLSAFCQFFVFVLYIEFYFVSCCAYTM